MLTKAFKTRQFVAPIVVPRKRPRWVVVADMVVADPATPEDHDKCTTQCAAIVASLAKFLSNHGWEKMANQSSQFIAMTVSNQ